MARKSFTMAGEKMVYDSGRYKPASKLRRKVLKASAKIFPYKPKGRKTKTASGKRSPGKLIGERNRQIKEIEKEMRR